MRKLPYIFMILLLGACSTSPVPIEYGKDGCHYCKMTIVEKKFGAEIVTSKGKVFKFDALECLVNHSKQNPRGDGDHYYVIDYLSGDWALVEEAIYLRSKNIPSPMGQYITSLAAKDSADNLAEKNGGVIQSWNELIVNFDVTNLEDF